MAAHWTPDRTERDAVAAALTADRDLSGIPYPPQALAYSALEAIDPFRRAELARLRDALSFYADPDLYDYDETCVPMSGKPHPFNGGTGGVLEDDGEVARAALDGLDVSARAGVRYSYTASPHDDVADEDLVIEFLTARDRIPERDRLTPRMEARRILDALHRMRDDR